MDFRIMIGLSILDAASMRRSPRGMLSRYMPMTFVSGSRPKYSRKSTSSRSSLLPMLANLAMPTFSSVIRFQSISPTPPLCEMIDSPPLGGLKDGTKGRHNPFAVLATVTPFGPTNRMPYCRAFCNTNSESFFPSSPDSLNPPDGMAMRFTPARPQESMTSGISLAGIIIKTRSGTTGRSCMSLYILMPST